MLMVRTTTEVDFAWPLAALTASVKMFEAPGGSAVCKPLIRCFSVLDPM